tara:strand:- start:2311 stop:3594 length:1284 start_codon:yes stop_codon:yes gene_type:complete
MTFSIIRFWLKGWIETIYIEPSFHFSYYFFEWIKPIGSYTYLLFFICGISAFMVALGYRYKLSIIVFFLSFTYIELMDKTTYLNHYYFISILSFLMIFLPANSSYSFDSFQNKVSYKSVFKWNVDCIKLLLFIVYFYSGLAKINSDWLIEAQPLKIWLTSNYDLPVIGELMQKTWIHYFMSWGGMIYDLSIAFLLLYPKTRIFAFMMVIFFHLFTAVLFPIGMFPYIMIMGSIIFFDSKTHKNILNAIFSKIGLSKLIDSKHINKNEVKRLKYKKVRIGILSTFFIIQVLFPFRYFFYPGELFWNEQGYRFSWRVMLIEKKGYTNFKVFDKNNNTSFYIKNEDFLTEFQERQMSFQPDFILEFAHHIGDFYKENGIEKVEVYADSYVTLNGRMSKRFINPKTDLYNEKRGFKHKEWIIPINENIKGF